MRVTRRIPALAGVISTAFLLAAAIGQAQAPQAPAAAAALWTAFDADTDGSVTRAEMKRAFDKWYDATDTAGTGSVTTDQLGPALNTALALPAPAPPAAPGGGRAAGAAPAQSGPPCGGRGNLPTVGQTPCPDDVTKMMAALPAAAPAKPAKAAQGAGARQRPRLRPWVDSARRQDD